MTPKWGIMTPKWETEKTVATIEPESLINQGIEVIGILECQSIMTP